MKTEKGVLGEPGMMLLPAYDACARDPLTIELVETARGGPGALLKAVGVEHPDELVLFPSSAPLLSILE